MGFTHPNEGNEQACNTFGMFRCECHDGYKLDGSGGNCTDIDECESPQSCLYGECLNTQGSFKCVCPPHYELGIARIPQPTTSRKPDAVVRWAKHGAKAARPAQSPTASNTHSYALEVWATNQMLLRWS
nr:unnamed protein product [Callosobruchus chinensis]